MIHIRIQKYLAIFSALIMLTSITALVSDTGQFLHTINSPGEGVSEQVVGNYSTTITQNIPNPIVPVGVLNYTSFYVVNNQNKSSPVPFDLEVKVDSSALRSYENPGLSNVEWFTPNGTVIPSWIQCNPSSASTCTVYWLKLNFSIPADSNTSIGMGFASLSTNLMTANQQYEGEAPQLSSHYGEYDNGASIFPFYCNFSGLPFQNNWITFQYSTANVSIYDGLVVRDSYNDAYAYAITKDPVIQPEIIESLVTEDCVTAGSPNTVGIAVSTSHNLTNHLVYSGTPYDYYFQNGFEASLFNNGNSKNSMTPSFNGTPIYPQINFTNSPFLLGIGWAGTSTQYWYLNGNTVSVTHNDSIQSSTYYPNIGMTSGGSGAGILKVQYIRGRYMPPNNVMPGLTGKYVVKSPGFVDITVSGIPSSNTWYLNISGISGIAEHGTLSLNITLPYGLYYYNVSTYYSGSVLYGYGTFQVKNNSGTFVLIVFTPRQPVITPTEPAPPYPPELYALIAEIVVLVSGAVLILLSRFRKFKEE